MNINTFGHPLTLIFGKTTTGELVPLQVDSDGKIVTSGGGGTPGGSTTQLQYNNAGAFDGDAGLTWDNADQNLRAASFFTVGDARSVATTYLFGVPAAAVFTADGNSMLQTAYVDSVSGAAYAGGISVYSEPKAGGGSVGVLTTNGGLNGELGMAFYPSDDANTDIANAIGVFTRAGGSFLPVTTDQTDIGRSAQKWKDGYFSGTMTAKALALTEAVAFADATTAVEGTVQAFTDSTTATWGATITGGGANHVLGYYNGTNWTVIGK